MKTKAAILVVVASPMSCSLLYDYDALTRVSGGADKDGATNDAMPTLDASEGGVDPISCDNLPAGSFCENFNSGVIPPNWFSQTTAGSTLDYPAALGPDGTGVLRARLGPDPTASTSNIQREMAGPIVRMSFAADHYIDADSYAQSDTGVDLIRVQLQPSNGNGSIYLWVGNSGALNLAVGFAKTRDLGVSIPLRKWTRLAIVIDLSARTATAFVNGTERGQLGVEPDVTSNAFALSLGCPYAAKLVSPVAVLIDNARFDKL